MKTVRLSLVMVLFFAGLAFGGTVKNYSADMVDVNSNKVTSKVFVSDTKMRLEGYDANGKLESYSIVRLDQKKMYVFQPEKKTYMEFPLRGNGKFITEDLTAAMGQGMGSKPEIKREKQGSEKVSSYQTDKYRVTSNFEMMGQKISAVSYEWIAPEFDLPIRTQTDKNTLEMRNIKTSAPEASLFEIPSGFTKEMPVGNAKDKPAGNVKDKPAGNAKDKPAGNAKDKPAEDKKKSR